MINLDGKVSVIMPGYNEGENIYDNLVEVDRVLSTQFADYEIVFVNDGSRDATLDGARKAGQEIRSINVINCVCNQGKGYALRVGTAAAKGKYIVFMDADLDLHPSQLPRFFEIMVAQDADVVIGSKMHPQSISNYPLVRRIISFGYYLFLLVFFRLNTHDTQTGMKLFRADVIKPVMNAVLVKRFAFDIEVLSIIHKRGYKIAESPIILDFHRSLKWGRIRARDVYDIIIDSLAIFYRLNILHYYDQSEYDLLVKPGSETIRV
jgi:glycosyltransferase involved in cell wall biosynthesis